MNISAIKPAIDDNHRNNNKLAQTYEVKDNNYLQTSIILFQICQSCFWCTSSLNRIFHRCPACQRDTIDSMAVATAKAIAMTTTI